MAQPLSYHQLALEWQPDNQSSRLFSISLWASIALFLCLSLALSYVQVPETSRQEQAKVPERIANFVAQQPKKIEPPKPKPLPPPPKLQPRVTNKTSVSRQNPVEVQKPLTEKQQKARDVASNSGLLALSSELADMTDTSAVDTSVRARLSTATNNVEATHKIQAIAGNVAQSGKAVNQDAVIGQVDNTQIAARTTQGKTAASEKVEKEDMQLAGSGTGRAGSDIGLVFNKNKTLLYSLYERERRKNASLKGKIVFQLSIAPNGKVNSVKIISSELKNSELEGRLLARIKTFSFAPTTDSEDVTVNYPVEFVPS